MDDNLKRLTQELGQAIDQAINEAPRVKELTQKLRQAGYETILMVEATICFAKRPASEDSQETSAQEPELSELMSKDDLQFLKKLKISVEDMDS